MKSFGGIPNEDELIPLMQSQQDKVLEELNQAVEDIQRTGCEGHNEVLEALNYVLEQSTIHKQDVERDLKDTREGTEQLYTALQELAANITNDSVDRHEGIKSSLNAIQLLLWGVLGSILTSTAVIAYLVVAL